MVLLWTRRTIGPGAAVVFCLLAGILSTPVVAATNQLAFSPSSATVAVGGNASVDITVANVSNLGGYDLHLQFNPAVVHLTSLVDAGFVTNNPNNIVVCNAATIDNSAGTATDSCATSPFPPPGAGVSTTTPVALMHASFTGVGAGTASLTLTGTTLVDPNGVALTPAPTLGTGSITVSASSVGGVAEAPDLAALPSSDTSAYFARRLFIVALAGGMIMASIAVLIGLAWRGGRKPGEDLRHRRTGNHSLRS